MSEANVVLTVEINGEPVTASMDEWVRVEEAVRARRRAVREAWEAERRAAGQVWLAVYWRHWSVYSQEFFSYEDARAFLEGSSENGDIGGHAIKLPSGEYVKTYTGQPEPPENVAKWEAELR